MSETRVNRRVFLGQTAALGMAASTIGLASAADAPSNRLVVGVMGCSRGKSLADTFAKLPGCVVKYVCDVDEKRAGALKETLEKNKFATTAITDFRKILDDREVDALICAAPNHWHAPATILACKSEKHVYVEKPCSHTPQEGEWMVAAARKYQRVVQMGTQRRSSPRMKEAIELLRSGAIGRVYLARSWYANTRPSIGRGKPADVPGHLNYELWQGPATRKPYVDNLVHYNWHWRWHWGNGELGNNGVHALDLCRWGLEVDHPVRVTSSGGRYAFDDDQETPDTHTVAFEFDGRKQITWEGLSCNRSSLGFVTFYGEKGTLAVDGGCGFVLTDEKGKEVQKSPGNRGDVEHAENFLAAIREKKPSLLNCEILEGHRGTLLCHLGNIAQRTGRVLTTNPQDGHILHDTEAMQMWSKEYHKDWQPTV